MTEPVSSSPSSSSSGMTIDIRPMIEDVSQVMTKHITTILSGVIGEYTIYKQTHDTIMGLPCVRKLQERIADLEHGGSTTAYTDEAPMATSATTTCSNSREDEILQLQSAIAEMNRYILALESKVDMKAVCSSKEKDEESVRLEIHEEDHDHDDDDDEASSVDESTADSFAVSSTHKNVIISTSLEEDADGQVEEESEDDTLEEAAAEEEEKAAEEEATEEEAAEEEEAAQEEEEEEAAEEEAAEEVAEEEEEEAAQEEEEEEAAEEEEAEIEVSEVKIKGKTYFTTDAQNGIIYACVDDDVGDEVGVFKNGVAVFNKGKK